MPTFVVETGTGSSTANSYCSVATADAYHDNYGNPATWTGASTATKEAALRQATRALDLRYGDLWSGFRKTAAQALDWPREYASDSTGETVSDDSVPLRVQQAAALMALYHVQGETLLPATSTGGDIKSESLSSASGASKSVVYIGGKTVATSFPMVDNLLATGGLITGGTGGGWGWLDL
ncbi:MAG: DnaT-like ssDNA-binding protein [Pseudomonadota bacterium]|jgi:hypothetical protein